MEELLTRSTVLRGLQFGLENECLLGFEYKLKQRPKSRFWSRFLQAGLFLSVLKGRNEKFGNFAGLHPFRVLTTLDIDSSLTLPPKVAKVGSWYSKWQP